MKKLIKRILLFIIGFVLFFIVVFYVITGGKGTYKVSEGIGYSETLKESKKRGVFITELQYKIIPDTIKFAENRIFFIEKGYRYGKYSADETLPLRKTDKYKYQIVMSPASGEIFIGDYLLGSEGDKWLFNKIKDTFKRDIVTKVPQYDSIYKVGELILFHEK